MNEQLIAQIIIGIFISVASGFVLLYIKNNMTREYKITEKKLDDITDGIKNLIKNYHDLKLELVEKVGSTATEIAILKEMIKAHDQRITDLEKIVDRRGGK